MSQANSLTDETCSKGGLMISENQHLTRQMDLIPLNVLDTPINIIGAGAIGSFTALALAKMGFHNITSIDFDGIDVENMNCQFFRFKDIGSAKVLALQELIEDFTRIKINVVNGMWDGAIMDGITMIDAPDTVPCAPCADSMPPCPGLCMPAITPDAVIEVLASKLEGDIEYGVR